MFSSGRYQLKLSKPSIWKKKTNLASLGKSLYDHIINDVMDSEAPHNMAKQKITLHQVTSLLPIELERVECPVSFDLRLSEKVFDISTLRTQAFVLQKSFNDQAKYEEKKAQYRNDELVKNQMIGLIQQQFTLRRQKASALVKHPFFFVMNLLPALSNFSGSWFP